MTKGIVLFNNKEDCCGCGACMNICPKSAITMCEDEYGFIYPHIEKDKCIGCIACKKVCAYQNESLKPHAQTVYAAAAKDDGLIMKSASGGLFAVFAREFLREGGIVFGAALMYENACLNLKHIWIDDEADLYKLQGSKYVQSEIGFTYSEAKKFLDEGRKVLFSGTPCQIAGLKGFLKKEYDNLLTMDIICHGVPSARMFKDYIAYYEKKYKGRIINYRFRDKKFGQGMAQAFCITTDSGMSYTKIKSGELIGYMWEFLRSNTYRENCYSCKYAARLRTSDITVGDFWGIASVHPELADNKAFSQYKGISCVLINTVKCDNFMKTVKPELAYVLSDYDKAAGNNHQLREPSRRTWKRDVVLDLFKRDGYSAVEKFYRKDIGYKYLYYLIRAHIPCQIKDKLKKLKGR